MSGGGRVRTHLGGQYTTARCNRRWIDLRRRSHPLEAGYRTWAEAVVESPALPAKMEPGSLSRMALGLVSFARHVLFRSKFPAAGAPAHAVTTSAGARR
jgi:hypothetical protein